MASLKQLDDLSFSGEGLSVEERAGLEVAFAKRRVESDLKSIAFWGKVKGTDNDYLVAAGLGESLDYPQKQFFFCTSKSFALQALPALSDEFAAKAAGLAASRLKGDPSALPEGEEEVEEDEDEDAPKKERFSEVHRLAYAVAQIDRATAVVPRGAYLVSATHHVLRNAAFGGLDSTTAASLDNYYHFRAPEALARKSALERAGMVQSTDFLDSLAEDTPRGVWAVRVDRGGGVATLRSLLYPGYFFFHELGSGNFGGAYFGYGQVNGDIGFMV
eukprot:CAMPEP_0203809250 /NCGR_PEP_ID=MMETSP0115-20131106/2151_1 /ASSEMBLY_ACC=CAM_ASM_000227 /TAXON_ID=33651 /ORGANISM="Bicosoecid sp, Strain ms1" /LENGTH=273 /DNA_ID=CAMNT_0050717967 /DNA_START=96 /DNA_END=917 /DNA_ORIENTATION=+